MRNREHHITLFYYVLAAIFIAALLLMLYDGALRLGQDRKPIIGECNVGNGKLVITPTSMKFVRDGVTRHGELALFGIADELKVESTHELPPETEGYTWCPAGVTIADNGTVALGRLSVTQDGVPQFYAHDGKSWVGEPALRACAILWLVALSESERQWLGAR